MFSSLTFGVCDVVLARLRLVSPQVSAIGCTSFTQTVICCAFSCMLSPSFRFLQHFDAVGLVMLGSGYNGTACDGSAMCVAWTTPVCQNASYVQNVQTIDVVLPSHPRNNGRTRGHILETFLKHFPKIFLRPTM